MVYDLNTYFIWMNEANRELNKNQNLDCSQNDAVEKILEDNACFFKMSKEDAKKLLLTCGVEEQFLPVVYEGCIAYKRFKSLVECQELDVNDPELFFIYDENGVLQRKR